MDDKELLTLAAKAAGIEVFWGRPSDDQDHNKLYLKENSTMYTPRVWNPLVRDDHALRLAVKLEITVEFNSNWVGTTQEDIVGRAEFYEVDPYAATRRCIVRAAAEIGRGME